CHLPACRDVVVGQDEAIVGHDEPGTLPSTTNRMGFTSLEEPVVDQERIRGSIVELYVCRMTPWRLGTLALLNDLRDGVIPVINLVSPGCLEQLPTNFHPDHGAGIELVNPAGR